MKRKIISVLLAAAMLSSLLAGCGGPDGGGKSEALTLSPETTSVTTSDGITVVVGDYVLDGETELTVTKQPAEENKEEGYKIEAYDFTLASCTSWTILSRSASPTIPPIVMRGRIPPAVSAQSTKTSPPAYGRTCCSRWTRRRASW